MEMTVLAILIYSGGFARTLERKGFWRALVWPLVLGIVLADFVVREAAKIEAEDSGA